jgi:rubrerythrin
MTDNQMLADHLISLAQLDIDAIHAYTEAMQHIDVFEVNEQLAMFRADHERHVRDLFKEIVDLGGTPPEFKPDFKGHLITGMTALRSATGTEGALKAMRMNEELTNKTYEKALQWELTGPARQIIVRNREDERRHLAYVIRAIDLKIWERKVA